MIEKRHNILQVATDDMIDMDENGDIINISREDQPFHKTGTKQTEGNYSETQIDYFSKNSLFLFGENNPVRKWIQGIVRKRKFVVLINIVIVLNSVFLIFDTIDGLSTVSLYSNYFFTVIFTIEMFLKIIAYGFVLEDYTYLRDPWNWLDFIIVVTGLIDLLPDYNSNLRALRSFRLIRPLKTISVMPNMRIFISTLVNSFVDLSSVFLLLVFFFLIFSIVGLSLWSDRFEYLCRSSPTPMNGLFYPDSKFYTRLCGGENTCNDNLTLCLSAKDAYTNGSYFFSPTYNIERDTEIRELNYGITNFQNILASLWVVFQTTTGEGWSDIMYIMMDGYNYYASFIFFIVCLVFNYFFLLNLLIAVLLYNFEKNRAWDDPRRLLQSSTHEENGKSKLRIADNKRTTKFANYSNLINEEQMRRKYRRKYVPIKDTDTNKAADVKNLTTIMHRFTKMRCFERVKRTSEYHKKFLFGYQCYVVYKQPIVQYFFYSCIILNSILLCFTRVDQSELEYSALEKLNIFMVTMFALETFLVVFGMGIYKFTRDYMNIWDFIIVAISLIEIVILKNVMTQSSKSTSVASVFRMLRVLRIFKLIRSWQNFQVIVASIKETLIRMADYFILLGLFLLIFTLLGCNFFKNSLKFETRYNSDASHSFSLYSANAQSNYYNFDDFISSLVSVFQILIGDEWHLFFYDCFRSEANNQGTVVFFFFFVVLVGQFTLLNIFLAYLIDNFERARKHLYKNIRVKTFIENLIYYTSKQHEYDNIDYLSSKVSVFNYIAQKLDNKKLLAEGRFIITAKSELDFSFFKKRKSEFYDVNKMQPKINKFERIVFFDDWFAIGVTKLPKEDFEFHDFDYYDYKCQDKLAKERNLRLKKLANTSLENNQLQNDTNQVQENNNLISNNKESFKIKLNPVKKESTVGNNHINEDSALQEEKNKIIFNPNENQLEDITSRSQQSISESEINEIKKEDAIEGRSSIKKSEFGIKVIPDEVIDDVDEFCLMMKEERPETKKTLLNVDKSEYRLKKQSQLKSHNPSNLLNPNYKFNRRSSYVNSEVYEDVKVKLERNRSYVMQLSRKKISDLKTFEIDSDRSKEENSVMSVHSGRSHKEENINTQLIPNLVFKKTKTVGTNTSDSVLPKSRKNIMEKVKRKLTDRKLKLEMKKKKEKEKEHNIFWQYMKKISEKFKKISIYYSESSMGIFHKDWRYRRMIKSIVEHTIFDYTITILIIINCVILCIDNPWNDPNGGFNSAITYLNYFFSCVFLVEAFMKIIAYGFLFKAEDELKLLRRSTKAVISEAENFIKTKVRGSQLVKMNKEEKLEVLKKSIRKLEKEKAYLRDMSNLVDFIVVILSCIDLIGLKSANYWRTLRALRSIRPIRIITKNDNLKLIVTCLIKSVPAMGNVLLVCAVFIFIYAILGIDFFKDTMNYYCDNFNYATNDTCVVNGGKWLANPDNFSDFITALKTLFILTMAQGWADIMKIAEQNMQTKWTYLYFISYIIIGYLFILNLFVSIVVQKFKILKNREHHFSQLSEEEKEWIKVQKIMLKFHPVPKFELDEGSAFKKRIHEFVLSKSFENMTIVFILLSMVTLIIQFSDASESYNFSLDIGNYFFTFIFNIEIALKIFVYGKIFFKTKWNIFDLVVIILCDLMVLMNILTYADVLNISNLSSLPIILRTFRFLRIIRLLTVYAKLRALIDTLVYLVPSIVNIGIVMMILILIYSCIGMNLFGTVPYRHSIHNNNNFRSFLSSSLVLFRITTGEDWNKIMNELAYHNCTTPTSALDDFYCANYKLTCLDDQFVNFTSLNNNEFSCGNNLSYLYFISFMIIGPIFILNLCIVMVIEGFSESMYENESLLSQDYMDHFVSVWLNYDPKCEKVVRPHEFVLMLKELHPPLGFNYDRHYIYDQAKMFSYRKKFQLMKKYLESQNNFDQGKRNKTNFNLDKEANVIPNSPGTEQLQYKQLPNAFDTKNFYMSLDKKFYTTDLEIVKLFDKFKFTAVEKNMENNNHYSYTFFAGNKKENEEPQKNFYIHFVDACLGLSRFVVSKKNNISYDKLRENVVGNFAKKMWNNEYEGEDIDKYFKGKDKNGIDDIKTMNITGKIKTILKEKLTNIRKKIAERKLELDQQEKENNIELSKNNIDPSHSNNQTIISKSKLVFTKSNKIKENFSINRNYSVSAIEKENDNCKVEWKDSADVSVLSGINFKRATNLHSSKKMSLNSKGQFDQSQIRASSYITSNDISFHNAQADSSLFHTNNDMQNIQHDVQISQMSFLLEDINNNSQQ